MDLKEIKRLIQLVEEARITHFSIEVDNMKVEIKKELQAGPSQAYVLPPVQVSSIQEPSAVGGPVASVEPTLDDKLVPIKSQMVGTFYTASGPDVPPYVKVGDKIEAGQVVCIVEAMKLFNEIESEIAGVVEKAPLANATPVEYGQVLFWIRVD